MAAITPVSPFSLPAGAVLTPITLGASNTLVYKGAKKQLLLIQNGSGASVTATLDGSLAPDTIPVPGTGGTYNSAAGAVFTIAAGAIMCVPLGTYRALMKGNVTLTLSSATSVSGFLIEV